MPLAAIFSLKEFYAFKSLGLGMGGWASIKTMDEKVKEFELFDRCNGCGRRRGDGVKAMIQSCSNQNK